VNPAYFTEAGVGCFFELENKQIKIILELCRSFGLSGEDDSIGYESESARYGSVYSIRKVYLKHCFKLALDDTFLHSRNGNRINHIFPRTAKDAPL
jgi:hypothetical protein